MCEGKEKDMVQANISVFGFKLWPKAITVKIFFDVSCLLDKDRLWANERDGYTKVNHFQTKKKTKN